jgi:PAS domain S-box-containing protein
MTEEAGTSAAGKLRERLYEVMDDAGSSLAEKQRRALALGREYLGVEHGHLQRRDPDGETDTVVASDGEDPALLPEGTRLDRERTYCRRVVGADAPVALSDAPDQGWADDPAYREHGLDCYLGTTVFVRGEVYGTVCFTARQPRSERFDAGEKAFVELLARLLGREIGAADAHTDDEARVRKRSRPEYQALLQLAPEAIFLADVATGRLVEVNERAADLAGYSADELAGMDVLGLHPDGQRDRYARLYRAEADETRRDRFDDGTPLTLRRADGSEVPVEMSVGTVSVGGRDLVQAIVRDISDRRQRTRELARNREYLQQTQETADLGGWEVDFRSETLRWAEAVYRIHGVPLDYDPTVPEGLSFYHPDDRPAIERALERLRTEGEPFDLELRIQTDDGDLRWVHVVGRPEYEEGTVVAARGIFRDVTERVGRERDLRLRSRAIEEAPVGVTIADATEPDTPVVYANEGFERLTGYPRERVLGRNCRFLQGEGTDEDTRDSIRAAIESEESVRTEIRNYRADGTPFWNRLTVSPVAGEDGDGVTHFVGIQEDITATKRRQNLIEVLDRVLRHNLRNDMTAVMGFARAIAERSDGEVAAMAGRIFQTAADLSELTEKVRDFEAATTDPSRPGPHDATGVVESVVADLRTEYPDVEFRVDTCECEAVMATDRLDVALRELGTNAAEHGAPPVEFEVWNTDGGEVAVSVHDSGPGLPPCERTVLEAGRETPLEHGSGLGLWIVNWLITAAGGELSVTVEDGTTVTVRLQPATDGSTRTGDPDPAVGPGDG